MLSRPLFEPEWDRNQKAIYRSKRNFRTVRFSKMNIHCTRQDMHSTWWHVCSKAKVVQGDFKTWGYFCTGCGVHNWTHASFVFVHSPTADMRNDAYAVLWVISRNCPNCSPTALVHNSRRFSKFTNSPKGIHLCADHMCELLLPWKSLQEWITRIIDTLVR